MTDRGGRLLRIDLHVLAVGGMHLHQLPIGVLFSIFFQGLQKCCRLLFGQVNPLLFRRTPNPKGGKTVAKQGGGEGDSHVGSIRLCNFDPHGLLHKDADRIAVRIFYLY